MAIEKVHIYQNTSYILDEILAHRLGLIPLKADPRQFKMKEDGRYSFLFLNDICVVFKWLTLSENSEPNEHDSLVYEMKIKCTKKDLDALAHKQFISFPGKIVFRSMGARKYSFYNDMFFIFVSAIRQMVSFWFSTLRVVSGWYF